MADLVLFGVMIFNILLFGFILIPILSYHTYRYYELRDHIAMKKRYWILNIYEIIATLSRLFLAIITTFLLLFGLNFASPIFNGFNSIQQFSSYCMAYFQVWRFHILRYDIIFTNIALNDEWKTIINPFYLNNKNINKHNKLNWYFKNRTSYGNYKWFGLRIIAPFIIISTVVQSYILIHGSLTDESYAQIQHFQLFSVFIDYIPILMMIYLYVKTPFIEDTFFVRAEMKRLFIWKLILIFVYTAFLIYHQIYIFITL